MMKKKKGHTFSKEEYLRRKCIKQAIKALPKKQVFGEIEINRNYMPSLDDDFGLLMPALMMSAISARKMGWLKDMVELTKKKT